MSALLQTKRKHFLYLSFCDRLLCRLYMPVRIYDLQTSPDSSIKEHHRRIVREVEIVDHNRGQGTSKPSAVKGREGLWSPGIGQGSPTSRPEALTFSIAGARNPRPLQVPEGCGTDRRTKNQSVQKPKKPFIATSIRHCRTLP